MSIIKYDETTNTFSVYGQTFTADYFNHVEVPSLLNLGCLSSSSMTH